MRRLIVIALLCTLTLCSCQKKTTLNAIDKADDISIIYGVQSYAASISTQEDIKKILEYYNDLSVVKTDETIDIIDSLFVIISNEDNTICRFTVDKNGIILIDNINYTYTQNKYDNDIYSMLLEIYNHKKSK